MAVNRVEINWAELLKCDECNSTGAFSVCSCPEERTKDCPNCKFYKDCEACSLWVVQRLPKLPKLPQKPLDCCFSDCSEKTDLLFIKVKDGSVVTTAFCLTHASVLFHTPKNGITYLVQEVRNFLLEKEFPFEIRPMVSGT